MLTKEKLDRLNALNKRKQEGGLTPAEAAEQNQLREEYIRSFRTQFEGHLTAMGMQRTTKKASHSCSCGCGHKH